MEKRHFYTACAGAGETLSWADEWYTASWFTASQSGYDSQASTGPVDPPASVWATEPACLALQSSLSANSLLITSTASIAVITSGTQTGTIMTGIPVAATASAVSFSTPTATSTMPNRFEASSDTTRSASCAGDWDWQSAGTVSSLVLGLLFGAIVWGIWTLLKGKKSLATLYQPRKALGLDSPVNPSTDNDSAKVPVVTAIKLAPLAGLVALAAGLPLFLVGTPCLEKTSPSSRFGGRLGSHTDLSLMRLLNSLDPSLDFPSMTPISRSALVLRDLPSTIRPAVANAKVRLIILLVITCCFMLAPALFTVARALNSLLGSRRRWLEETCDGEEIWWIPFKRSGPRQITISEKQAMALASKHGLLDAADVTSEDNRRSAQIRAIYAVPDTTHLDSLIERRAEVLGKLEMAQARYIRSFKANPMANRPQGEEEEPKSLNEKRTSFLPKRLRHSSTKRDSGGVNAPTQYVAPKTFYTLRPLPAVPSTSDDLIPRISEVGRGPEQDETPTFSEQVENRVVGSRFLEVQRSSGMFSELPVGADLRIGTTGQLEPQALPATPDTESSLMLYATGSRPDIAEPRPISRADSIRFPTPDNAYARPSMSPERGAGIDDPLLGSPPALPPKPREPVGYQPIQSGGSLRRPPARKRTSPSFAMVSEDPQILQGHQPTIRPNSGVSPLDLSSHYQHIKTYRPLLIQLNDEIAEAQSVTYEDMARGQGNVGLLIVGRNLYLPGATKIIGSSRESVKWDRLQRANGSSFGFWVATTLLTIAACVLITPFLALAVASAPGLSHYIDFLEPLARNDSLSSGLAEGVVPAIAISLILLGTGYGIKKMAKLSGSITHMEERLKVFKGLITMLLVAGGVWPILAASFIYAIEHIDDEIQTGRPIADGSTFFSWNLFCLMLNLAVVVPAVILLQPGRLFRRMLKKSTDRTPRQQFRALQPRPIDPTVLLAVTLYALAISLVYLPIFPLIVIPLVLFLVLTFVAYRYFSTSVHVDRDGDSGGLLAILALRIMGLLVTLIPLLFGLILLSRREWTLGAIALAVAVAAALLFETFYRIRKRNLVGKKKKDAAMTSFEKDLLETASHHDAQISDQLETQPLQQEDGPEARSRRRSNASIFEMIAALAPTTSRETATGDRISVHLPLMTEAVNDMIDTRKAASLHSHYLQHHADQPHVLPPLGISNSTSGLTASTSASSLDPLTQKSLRTLYPPALIAPNPTLWLLDDPNGIGRMEVSDLQRWHRLDAIVG